ncbi:LOW QUALITY PROTEIN: hypothetical protein U0070_008804 [Myodes glareolus]|uniref:Cytochrome P450 n=1 Tax=Myodes glareolus TaxID=447135 RepID=A0AAW0IJU8_MYOGA
MSVSALSLTRFAGSISGFLQVVSVLGLLLLLLKAVQFYLQRQWLLKAFQQFPSPPFHWFFGHKQFEGDQELQMIMKVVENFPNAFPRWFLGSQAYLKVYDPDYMKVIMGRSDPKAHIAYRLLAPWISYGLLLLNGQPWFQHRRMLTTAFHYDILKPYVKTMADSDKWEQLAAQGSSIEIFQHISLMTLDTVMKCAFSHKGSVQVDGNYKTYIQAIADLNNLFYSRVRNIFHQNDTIYSLSSNGRLADRVCQLTHYHTDGVIKMRKDQLQDEGELEKVKKKRRLDFLDILLFARTENGDSLSDKDIRAETHSCSRAMTPQPEDSPESSMLWPHTLNTNRDAGRKFRASWGMDPPLPGKSSKGGRTFILWDGPCFRDHLDQMPYTTMCIKEAMRLYPPVPGVVRELSKPVTFPDGRSLPKVILSIYALHHNLEMWPNPEVFDPSRFAPDSPRHSHSFLSFSGGARNCIGKQFAMNELKVVVALTLLCFELLADCTRVPVPLRQLVLKAKNGIYLQLKKIH